VQVLAKFYGGSPAKAQRRKTRKPVASPDYLMQCCRIVLRHVADADKGEVFSILIGGPEGHGTGKVRGMVARPLDFRTIDARLASGAYGGLPEAFAADVRQVWLLSNGNLCSVMGLLCFFFFHFYRKLSNKLEHIIELEGPSHILNCRYGAMWKKFTGVAVIWWSLPTPCLSSLRVFTRSRYDCLIVVHGVVAPCICLLSASQCYVQVFLLLPEM
jgi:hypothetical protein